VLKKKLELKLRPPAHLTNQFGFRDVSASEWGYLLQSFGCQILNTVKNEHFDAYLLSESSLFVYQDKVIMKTCGTTRTLSCLPTLFQYARNVFDGEFNLEYALFTRRNYKYPDKQVFPHTSWEEEVNVLKQHFSAGKEYIIGDVEGEHFYVFMDDQRDDQSSIESYTTLEVAMNELPRKSVNYFYKNENYESDDITYFNSGLNMLLPRDAVVDAMMFDPFGYSLNGLNDSVYYTMHITPQEECSYVSYETNVSPMNEDVGRLVDKVVTLFNPGKFTVAMIHSRDVKPFFKEREFIQLDISKHFVLNFYSF